MADRIPPLLWVRVFEVAARHGNFVDAAKELSITAGAISRTVKELEQFMGVALFVRRARGVGLTDVGLEFSRAVAPGIRQIATAVASVHASKQQKTLRVTAMPALAQRWLVPRLAQFGELHPDITVTVSADSAVLELSQTHFDLALRYDNRQPPGCELVELFGEDLFPMISPRLAGSKAVAAPSDLFQFTALHDTYWESDWALWLSSVGIEPPKRWRALYFTLYTMAIDAAVAGQGVLMGHSMLVQEELASGKLIAPFGLHVTSPKRYYALVHPERSGSPAVRSFVDWLSMSKNG